MLIRVKYLKQAFIILSLIHISEPTRRSNGVRVILVSPAEDWMNEDEQKAFLKRYGAADLEAYVDRKAALATDFGIFTSPHAVLVNGESMEIGRIRGSVDWDDEDVIEYIYKIKAQN